MIKVIVGILALVILIGGWFLFTSEVPESASVEEAQVSTLVAESQMLVGVWQSTQDAQAQIIFNEDGTTSDLYADTELSSGVWELYENKEAEYNPSGLFLRSVLKGESFEYAVITLSEKSLFLNYLERGNILEYRRISE